MSNYAPWKVNQSQPASINDWLSSNYSPSPQGQLGSGTYDNLTNYGQMPTMFGQTQPVGDWTSGFGTPSGTGIPNIGADPVFKPESNWFKDSGILGSTDLKTGIKTDGWGGLALGAASGLVNAYMGMQQYGLSKDIFENNKQQFERNFNAQKGTINSQLADRQDKRNAQAAVNGNPMLSTEEYMKKYGVI